MSDITIKNKKYTNIIDSNFIIGYTTKINPII